VKIVVLDAYATNPGDLSWDFLEQFGHYIVYYRSTPEQAAARAFDCEVVLTNKTVLMAEQLSQMPKLRYVGLLSTGYNVVDVAYAKEHGITVTNIPSYSTEAVAQLTFALLLELTNQVGLHSTAVREGAWTSCPDFSFQKTPLVELQQKTFGIIGFGKIGQQVSKIAEAFGMRVLAHSDVPPPETAGSVEFVSLEELLRQSDVVSLHVPLTDATTGMVNADFLAKMKPSAFLLNTARGPVVDEAALAEALENGLIAGAGADVLSAEPPEAEHPLLNCKNCFVTPHIGWAGLETRRRLLAVCEENLRAFLEENPVNVVNP